MYVLTRRIDNVVARRVHISGGVNVMCVTGDRTENIAGDGDYRNNNAELGNLAGDTADTRYDAEDSRHDDRYVQTEAHIELVLNACDVVVDALAEGRTDLEALVEIEVRLTVEKENGVAVFVVLDPSVIGAEHLLGTVDRYLVGAETVNGAVLEAYHGVSVDGYHAFFKHGKLRFAVRKCGFTGCKLILCVGKLLFRCGKLRKTVFICLELCLTVGYHLLHINGEVGDILGNVKTELCTEGANNSHEPYLSIAESVSKKIRQFTDHSVTELDILIEVGHQRLYLAEELFAFVVCIGVFGYGLLARFVLSKTFIVCLVARTERVGAFTVCQGAV